MGSRPKTKKAGSGPAPLLACRCTNCPFFQDIQVKVGMRVGFQKT
jgi:hypothetical protein